jgi:hypothetical protein
MALMAPLLISYGLALAPLAAIPASEAFLCSLLPVLVVLGMQPLADCYKLSERTNDTKQLNLFIFWWGGNGLLILALFVIIRVPDLPIQYAALAVTWLVSISMWWYYDRAYRLGRFDLFPRRSRRRG